MKKLLLILPVLFLWYPNVSHAAFPTYAATFSSASSQYLSRATPTSFPTGSAARTIELWFKYSGSGEQTLADFGTDSGTQQEFDITLSNTGPTLYIRLNGGHYDYTATGATDGAWHHLAITYNGSGSLGAASTKAYLDGSTLTSSGSGGTLTVNTANNQTTIGAAASTPVAAFLDGKITLERVWTVVRTSSEITTNWCTELGATTNLVAEWTLDNVLTDNSGTGNTLTNNNSVTFTTDVPSLCAPASAAPTLFPRIFSWF